MEINIITTIASLGVGAVFGIVVFIIYRIDRKASEQRFEKLCQHHDQKWTVVVAADQKTREGNTKALTELINILTKMNGKH